MFTEDQVKKEMELSDDNLDDVTGGASKKNKNTITWSGYHSAEHGDCPYCGSKGITLLRDSCGNYKCDKCHAIWR